MIKDNIVPEYEYMVMFKANGTDAKPTTIGFTSLKMFTQFAVSLAQNGIHFAPLTRVEAQLKGFTPDQIKNEFTTRTTETGQKLKLLRDEDAIKTLPDTDCN